MPKFDPTDPIWTSGPQPVPQTTAAQFGGLATFGLSVGALSVLARAPLGAGKRGIDYMIGAVRNIEEYSPGRIFRTFQVSHMLSPMEQMSRQTRYLSPEILSQLRTTEPGNAWLRHLERLAGAEVPFSQGLRFEGGRLYVGTTSETYLRHAGVIRSPTGATPSFQQAYARSLKGGPLFEGHVPDPIRSEVRFAKKVFAQKIPFLSGGTQSTEAFMFTGGQSRAQAIGRYIKGYGTALGERINQLARAPFELEPLASIFSKVPGIRTLQFGVVPSSGLKTVGKIVGKLGILGYAGYLAYQQLDYEARQSEFLNDTIFDEGITAGLAGIWTKGQLATSRILETIGFHKYREAQEEIAPGSTQLSKLLAFPIAGAFGALGMGYAQRVSRQSAFRRQGLSLGQASIAATAQDAFFRKAIHGTSIPQELMTAADERTLSLIRQQTEEKLAGWQGRLGRRIAKMQTRTGVLGKLSRVLGPVSPTKLKTLAGAGIGLALVAPFIPGALIPEHRPDELEDLYSGRKRVAIRKGRWWEFGRTPYEGQRIERFQKHWYPRMLARAKEKSIWGEEAPGPFEQFYLENFTYELEKRHYEERPYPITGTAFEDIPFIGPLLAATVGRLVKPPRLMHTEEWMRPGEGGEEETLRMPLKFGEKVLPGELETGSPVSPYGAKGILGEQAYRLTEMIGLPGFTMTSIKESITGTPDLFDQEMQLESARRMYGAEREYWDLELGGGLGTTELIRRLYPYRRRQIEQYNPIRNKMPDWLPGPGEKSPDFLHGDPFTKVPAGESRLPGVGYAALNPELEGVDPEDYPAVHRLAILGDVAPYSSQYQNTLAHVRGMRKRGQLAEEEEALFQRTLEEVKARKVRKEFNNYKYRERAMTAAEEILAGAKPQESPGWFSKVLGSYWETLAHNAETPFEFLTPISPTSKLVHMRTAIEDYERTQVYGTENAFWQHPVRDFFGPFFDNAKHALGFKGIPDAVQEKRDLEEYFDILKYVKYTGLKRKAQAARDEDLVKEYEDKRRETLFGINPYTYNFSHIFRSLPRRDRDYFNEFVEADLEERKEILGLLPENERQLLIARWKLKDANDLKQAIKKDLLTEEQVQQADDAINQLYEEQRTEGLPKTQELWQEYLTTRLQGESYPDWYRRVYLLDRDLEGRGIPGPDWVGWHPAVDLEDIKLKIVDNEGRNAYDYDLWPDRRRAVARRPFIAEAAEQLQQAASQRMTASDLRDRIDRVLAAHNINNAHVSVSSFLGDAHNIDLNLQEDRSEEMRRLARRGEIGHG